MYLNGIMLISAVLDFTTLDFNINNDLPYILFLPGYTATACITMCCSRTGRSRPGSRRRRSLRSVTMPGPAQR